jgi:hypothetical protein
MTKKNYDALMKALDEQIKEVTSSKKAARKFLKERDIFHLFVDKEPKNKSTNSSQ